MPRGGEAEEIDASSLEDEESVEALVSSIFGENDEKKSVRKLRCALACLRSRKVSEGAKRRLIRRLGRSSSSSSSSSETCLKFAGGAGLEIFPGGGRAFAKRAHKCRGYAIATWTIEDPVAGRFELVGVGGGAIRVEIEPRNNAWRVEVFANGRLRGSADVDVGDRSRWRLSTVSHSSRYLSQALLEVRIGSAEAVTFSTALPTPDECERAASADALLRPPALRALRGFSGRCGGIWVYDGVASAETFEMLVGGGLAAAPPSPPPGEQRLGDDKPPRLPRACVDGTGRAWVPRGELELELASEAPPVAGVSLGEGVSLLRCPRRAAFAAVGGLRTLAGALEPLGREGLELCARVLREGGRAHATETLENRALFAIAARVDDVDGVFDLVDAAAPWPKLHAASLEAFFVKPWDKEDGARKVVREAAERVRRDEEARRGRRFAAAFRAGVGVARLARLARREGLAATVPGPIRLVVAAVVLDELEKKSGPGGGGGGDAEKEEEEFGGVVDVLEAATDDTGDPRGVLREALLEALCLAVARAKKPRRAAVARLARKRAFAETTAVALARPGAYYNSEGGGLAVVALRLALWQLKTAEHAARAALAASDESREQQKEARRRARRSSSAKAEVLAALVSDALDASSGVGAVPICRVLGLDDDDDRDNRAPRLAPPPLWLAAPFVAGVAPHLPERLRERAVAAACAKAKSHDDLSDLEPRASVGAFLRLASRCRGTTVEILALDVASALVLRRRATTSGCELDRAALAWCAAAVPAPWSEAAANIEWASRALAAVLASSCRRLATTGCGSDRRVDDDSRRILTVALDKLLPLPPSSGKVLKDILGPRGPELGMAIADLAHALCRAAERSMRDRRSPPRDALRFSKSVASLAKRAIVGSSSSAEPPQDAVALRQCGRALARAIFWGARDAAQAAKKIADLRACVALGVDLADEKVSKGAPSAAVVATDDALHAGACLAARLELEDDEVSAVAASGLLGLVRDCVRATGTGLAAACVRSAFEPAALASTPRAALAALRPHLDAALARDAADQDAFADAPLEEEEEEEEDDDDDEDSSFFGKPRRLLIARGDASTARARSAAADRRDARTLAASKDLAEALARDVALELGDSISYDECVEEEEEEEETSFQQQQQQQQQRTWELARGNGLATPDVVARRLERVASPLRPHDDDADSDRSWPTPCVTAKEVAKHVAIRDVNARRASDDDEDFEEEEAAGAADASSSSTPRGAMLRSFDAQPNNKSVGMPRKTSFDEEDDATDDSYAAAAAAAAAAAGRNSSSLGPSDGPFSATRRDKFSHFVDGLWRVERPGLSEGAVGIARSKEWLVFVRNSTKRSSAWRVRDVAAVLLRRFRLRDTAVEIYFRRGETLFVDLAPRYGGTTTTGDDEVFGAEVYAVATRRRDELVRKLIPCVRAARGPSSDGIFPLLQAPRVSASRLLRKATRAWQDRRVSNYEYLCVVNALAGRSFSDPCQYPVFPWIVADYSSDELDLGNPKSYRDLSKPMGALNAARLKETLKRYESFLDPHVPRFHYGSHYSTSAGVVMHYLLRLAPFASLHCDLQGGRFDVADRLFASIPEAWAANSGRRGTSSSNEVKELTPEWYATPAFLTNRGRLPLGTSQDGVLVGDVELPPWARGSPHSFISATRAALESEFVSQNIHLWLDLVFGYKQQGPAAVDAHNVFFYLCYPDAVDLDAIEDPKLRASTVLQASHFGTCPTQLFAKTPHPRRGPRPAHVPRPLLAAAAAAAGTEMMDTMTILDDFAEEPLGFAPNCATVNLLATLSRDTFSDESIDSLAIAPSASLAAVMNNRRGRITPPPPPPPPPPKNTTSPLFYPPPPPVFQQHHHHGAPPPPPPPPPLRPLVALRATAARCVGVDAGGHVCAFSWGYDVVVEQDDGDDDAAQADPEIIGVLPTDSAGAGGEARRRRASIRALAATASDVVAPVDSSNAGGQQSAAPACVVTEALNLGPVRHPRLVAISSDARFVAAPETGFPRALRVLELAPSKLGDSSLALRGDASVVATNASRLTFVRFFDDEDENDDQLRLLLGAADATASVWRLDRAAKLFGRRKTALASFPDAVFRGHASPIVAGDADAALRVAATAAEDGALLLHSIDDAALVRRLKTRGADAPRCVLVSRRRAVVVLATETNVVEVHSVNGGLVSAACLGYRPVNVKLAGHLDAAILVVGPDQIDLLAIDKRLAPLRSIKVDAFHPAGGFTPKKRLLDADLAPDSTNPAALFAATSDAKIALRILAKADDWFDKRASVDASVGAMVARRANQVIGLAAAAFGKTHELASVTEAISTEAISWVSSTRRTLVSKINNNNNNNNRPDHAHYPPPPPPARRNLGGAQNPQNQQQQQQQQQQQHHQNQNPPHSVDMARA
ncbi:hypothetical protein CTAYLR_004894 [Chrysophaeum taylorii]|uniref:BEACH domain-containing protein n=1 Tax=Chrysophaeum taylorii TaxID=2483200 RepID=A0AAD7UPH0_9STRA|nr:hypothetical protein CTAYLR_004894 [Chrysophaeum taylorii]